MKTNMKKRIVMFLLTLVFTVTILPVTAFAGEAEAPTGNEQNNSTESSNSGVDDARKTLVEINGAQANIKEGNKIFANPMKGINVFLGVVVVALTVGMTIFTAFDLAYIAFPIFRGKMDEVKANKGGGDGKGAPKQSKLQLITDDAQYAVKTAEVSNTGQNAFVIYFKKRAISIVALSIVIFLLLTGNMTAIIDMGLTLTQGLLDIISSFGQSTKGGDTETASAVTQIISDITGMIV